MCRCLEKLKNLMKAETKCNEIEVVSDTFVNEQGVVAEYPAVIINLIHSDNSVVKEMFYGQYCPFCGAYNRIRDNKEVLSLNQHYIRNILDGYV